MSGCARRRRRGRQGAASPALQVFGVDSLSLRLFDHTQTSSRSHALPPKRSPPPPPRLSQPSRGERTKETNTAWSSPPSLAPAALSQRATMILRASVKLLAGAVGTYLIVWGNMPRILDSLNSRWVGGRSDGGVLRLGPRAPTALGSPLPPFSWRACSRSLTMAGCLGFDQRPGVPGTGFPTMPPPTTPARRRRSADEASPPLADFSTPLSTRPSPPPPPRNTATSTGSSSGQRSTSSRSSWSRRSRSSAQHEAFCVGGRAGTRRRPCLPACRRNERTNDAPPFFSFATARACVSPPSLLSVVELSPSACRTLTQTQLTRQQKRRARRRGRHTAAQARQVALVATVRHGADQGGSERARGQARGGSRRAKTRAMAARSSFFVAEVQNLPTMRLPLEDHGAASADVV